MSSPMNSITALMATMKAAAEKATPGEWRRASTHFNGVTATPYVLGVKEVMIACASEKRDAEFITAACPANVLALIEALERTNRELVGYIDADYAHMLKDGNIDKCYLHKESSDGAVPLYLGVELKNG